MNTIGIKKKTLTYVVPNKLKERMIDTFLPLAQMPHKVYDFTLHHRSMSFVRCATGTGQVL